MKTLLPLTLLLATASAPSYADLYTPSASNCQTLLNKHISWLLKHEELYVKELRFQLTSNKVRESSLLVRDPSGYYSYASYMKGALSYNYYNNTLTNTNLFLDTPNNRNAWQNPNIRSYPTTAKPYKEIPRNVKGPDYTLGNWSAVQLQLDPYSYRSHIKFLDWGDTRVHLKGMQCFTNNTNQATYLTGYFDEGKQRRSLISVVLMNEKHVLIE